VLFGAMNFPIHSTMDELERFAAMGFDYLELTLDPPRAHYRQVLDEKARLEAALKRNGMALVCHMPTFVSLADLTESIREASLQEVLQSLETACRLGALKAVVHPADFRGLGALVPEISRELALQSLAKIDAAARNLGIEICLENMFPRTGFCVEVKDFDAVFARFPALKMTLDTGHANIESPGSKRLFDFIERFSGRIAHLHVSDNRGKRDDHLPLGNGVIPFPKVLRTLKSNGFNHTVTFEVFTEDREDLRRTRDRFRRIWDEV
jgi:sugar phosphate isomerase/epimerase